MQEVVDEQQMKTWEGYVDWRNKPAIKGRHGGMLAASFVLGESLNKNLLASNSFNCLTVD